MLQYDTELLTIQKVEGDELSARKGTIHLIPAREFRAHNIPC